METTHTSEETYSSKKEHTKGQEKSVKPGGTSVSGLAFKYGVIGGVCYILNFFLFKILGLAHIIELSFVNFIILAAVAFIALREFRTQSQMNYIQGFGTAFFISVVSFAVLSVFMYVYLTYIDTEFMRYIQTKNIAGITITPGSIVTLLFFEGTAIGAIVALVLMQYFKKRLNQSHNPGFKDNPRGRA